MTKVSRTPDGPEPIAAIASEKALLARWLGDPDDFYESAALGLRSIHFYFEDHRRIAEAFEVIASREDDAVPSLDLVQGTLQAAGNTTAAEAAGMIVYEPEKFGQSLGAHAENIMAAARERERWRFAAAYAAAPAEDAPRLIERHVKDLAALQPMSDLYPHPSILELIDAPTPKYLIPGLLLERTDHIIVAPTMAGKTALALHLILPLCRKGQHWIYVIAEGKEFFGQRVEAWCLANNVKLAEIAPYFHPIPCQINLLDPDSMGKFAQTIAVVLGSEPLQGVVIDTLSRCVVGAETSSEKDMGIAFTAIQQLRETFDCSTLTLAHPGHTGKDVRGSSVAKQWIGVQLYIEFENSGNEKLGDGVSIKLQSAKDKDHAGAKPIRFVASQQKWVTEDGHEQRSALVLHEVTGEESVDEGAKFATRVQRLAPNQRLAFEVLEKLAEGERTYGTWERASEQAGMNKDTWKSARKYLMDNGFVDKDGDNYACLGCSKFHPRVITPRHPRGDRGDVSLDHHPITLAGGVEVDTVIPPAIADLKYSQEWPYGKRVDWYKANGWSHVDAVEAVNSENGTHPMSQSG